MNHQLSQTNPFLYFDKIDHIKNRTYATYNSHIIFQ